MTTHTTSLPVRLCAVGAVVVALLVGSGCSQKYGAERDGKKLGEAVCDLSEATSAEEAQSATEEIEKQVNDLESRYALWTAQDRSAIDDNLGDLRTHVESDNSALVQQDLAVIQRNLEQAKKDASETTKAAMDGIKQGLDTCLN